MDTESPQAAHPNPAKILARAFLRSRGPTKIGSLVSGGFGVGIGRRGSIRSGPESSPAALSRSWPREVVATD